jgi:anaerobic selenocysteine-containing dehydrogenase
MHVHKLAELKATGDQELRLMTVRSEGQFNTVVYEEEYLYRNRDRRDVILMHPDDLQRFQLEHDQLVTVVSETGSLPNIRAREFESIRPGNALLYYPEANVLVARHADPDSKTPAFKGVVVELRSDLERGIWRDPAGLFARVSGGALRQGQALRWVFSRIFR